MHSAQALCKHVAVGEALRTLDGVVSVVTQEPGVVEEEEVPVGDELVERSERVCVHPV